jgi:hypothetical protein
VSGIRVADQEGWLIETFDVILVGIDRSRQRTQLASLNPFVLKDLGMSAADINTECRKCFWQR